MLLPSYHRLRLIVALALALANSSYAQFTVTAALEVPTTYYFDADTMTMAGGTLTFASGVTSNAFIFGGLAAAQAGTGYNIILQNTASAAIGLSVGNNNLSTLYAGVLSGLGSLYKIGTGTLTLTGANTYSGGTFINGGYISVGANNVLPSTQNVTVSATTPGANAYLVIGSGFSQTMGGLTFGGSTATATSTNYVVLNSAGSTLTLGDTVTYLATNNPYGASIYGAGTLALGGNRIFDIGDSTADQRDLFISSPISGQGFSLTKTGAGTLTLSGANTYTGGTTITGGILELYNSTLLGDVVNNATLLFFNDTPITYAGNVSGAGTLNKSWTGTLTLTGTNAYSNINIYSGGTLQVGNMGTTGSIAGSVDNGATLTFARSDDITFASNISGTGQIVQKGGGQLSLTGANTYTGGTISNAGYISIAKSNALAASGSVYINANTSAAPAGLILAAGFTQTIGALTFGGADAITTQNNSISLNTGSTLTLGGTVTYLATNNPKEAYVSGTGTLALGANRIFDIGNSTGTNSELNIYVPITGAGFSLTKTGAGRLFLTGANTYSGGTIINGGELFTGANNTLYTTGAVTINATTSGQNATLIIGDAPDANGNYNGTANGYNQTIGSLTFGGSDANNNASNLLYLNGPQTTLTLGGDVTYVATNNPLLAGIYAAGTLNLGANRVFNIGDSTSTTTELKIESAIAGTGFSLTKTGAGWLALTGTNTYTGGTTISAGTLELYNSTVLGDVVNNASLVVNNSVDGTYAGNISGTGAVTKGINTGILNLTGNNTFSGGLTLNGPVSVSSDTNLGAASGSLTFNNNSLITNANMTLASTRSVVLASGSTYGGFSPIYGTTLTYGGVISGSGGLYKWNSGTLTLTGASTYTGVTTIGYGKLLVTNSTGSATGSGAVVVNDGTTFGGTGSISGALMINSGGSVSPGASPGQLQVGDGTTFASGGRYVFEINSTVGTPGTNWDLLSISGGLTISATVSTPFVLDLVSLTAGNASGALANFNSANDYSWKFVTTTTGITGFSAGAFQYNASNFANNLNIGHFYVSQTGNDLYLNFTPVPEPTTWVLLSLGLSSVLLSLRRKSRARVVE